MASKYKSSKYKSLTPGRRVIVNAGPHAGSQAVIIDNIPIPDGGDSRASATEQRKIKVSIVDVTMENEEKYETYILPRLLDPIPVVVHGQAHEYEGTQQAALTVIPDRPIVPHTPITDPMDPALDRFRPNAALVERYISRMLPGGFTDIEALLHLRDQRDEDGYSPNVALVGETQSGKSMLVQVLACVTAERDGHPKPYPLFTLNGSTGVTSYDLFGQPTAVLIDGKETLVWMDGVVQMAADCGGILNLEEWNAVPPAQAVALHPLLDNTRRFTNTQKAVPNGHGGYMPLEVKVNPALWTLCTINPGYKGTQVMAEASTNRFTWLPWDYDEDVEKALIPSKSIRNMGLTLREMLTDRIVSTPIGTTALQRFNLQAATLGVDFAVFSFLALFPPNERAKVETFLKDGGKLDHLRDEYPTPSLTPAPVVTVEDESTDEPTTVGATWGRNSLGKTKTLP